MDLKADQMPDKPESETAEAAPAKIEFKPPSGFAVPDSSDPSKDWDVVCSFRTKADGTICLTKLGDTPMPGYESSKDAEEAAEHGDSKPGYENYMKSTPEVQGLGAMGGGGGGY